MKRKKYDIRGVDISVFRQHVKAACVRPEYFCDGSYNGIKGSNIGKCKHLKNGKCELVTKSMEDAKKR